MGFYLVGVVIELRSRHDSRVCGVAPSPSPGGDRFRRFCRWSVFVHQLSISDFCYQQERSLSHAIGIIVNVRIIRRLLE